MLNDMEKVELSEARLLPTESLQSRSEFFFLKHLYCLSVIEINAAVHGKVLADGGK